MLPQIRRWGGDAGSNIGERLEAGPRPRPAHWREAAVPTRVLTIPGLGTRGPGHVTRVAAAQALLLLLPGCQGRVSQY